MIRAWFVCASLLLAAASAVAQAPIAPAPTSPAPAKKLYKLRKNKNKTKK